MEPEFYALQPGAGFSRFLREGPLRWLDKPIWYAVGVPFMSIFGAATTFLAPMLLEPPAFGAFALLTVLFQNTMHLDLGLSQLADKILAAEGRVTPEAIEDLVQARWVIALVLGAVLLPLAMIIEGYFTLFDAVLAIVAGLAMMIANGRVVAFRTLSRIGEFTGTSLLLQAGLTLPRLTGLVVAGVTGCFGALAVWFGACAAVLARPRRIDRDKLARTGTLIRAGLPLFAFGAMWILYWTANRWISSLLTDHYHFGLFAFGASISAIAVSLITTIAQARYPKVIVALHRSRAEGSALVLHDVSLLGAGLTVAVMVGALLAGPVIRVLFPAFEEARAATIVIGVTCIPLGIVGWLLPVAIAFSTKPVRHSARVFGPAFLAMGFGMAAGEAMGGIVGQAWACVGASFVLVATLFLHMYRVGILEPRVCRQLLLSFAALVAGILGFALLAGAARADQTGPNDSPHFPADWKLVFEDNFDRLSLWDGKAGTWEPHYPWGARTNNDEREFYVDPRPGRDHPALVALEPFRIDEGILRIRATPIQGELRRAAQGQQYASGLLTTAKSFSLTYGYVEFRVRVPAGRGLWPALWLIPLDQSWPPEIDVMEVLGHETDRYWATLHKRGARRPTSSGTLVKTSDLSRDFHVFGVMWTEAEVTWFLDGKVVAKAPTPPEMHKPMYLVMNLAVGGSWPGQPDASTRFPAEFEIDYVRAYARPGKPIPRREETTR